jgi:hypothetical protein
MEEVRLHRYNAAAAVLAERLGKGLPTYSPIVHNHFITSHYGLPKTWEFWSQHDLPLLNYACELLILTLDGWDISKGVTAERAFAEENKIPVYFLEPA